MYYLANVIIITVIIITLVRYQIPLSYTNVIFDDQLVVSPLVSTWKSLYTEL